MLCSTYNYDVIVSKLFVDENYLNISAILKENRISSREIPL